MIFSNLFKLLAEPVFKVSAPTRTPTDGPTVAFVNQSTVATDAEIATIVSALQIQVDRDFSPVWKLDANLIAIPKGQTPPANSWIMYILDNSDEAGTLGYHDITDDGMPVGKIFAKTDQQYKLSLSVTMSHELLEALVDPWVQNTVFDQVSNTSGTLYSLEICDATEDDSFGYLIDGVLVSDFVFPAWFEGFREPNSTQFSFRNTVHAPYELASGGYIGLFAIPNTKGWIQKTNDEMPSKRMQSKGPYSRFNRRARKSK